MSMRTDPSVVADLRALFREGTTPSGLIKHIVACHPTEPNPFGLVQAYFREAFAVPLVRVSTSAADYRSDDLRLAHLNVHLVHEIVQHRAEWDSESASATGARECWLNSVAATDELALINQAHVATLPEFAGCWDSLGRDAQDYVKRLTGNVNALYEKVRILARLAESLQRRINEREEAPGHQSLPTA
jgi:hypothetical protein